MMISLQEKSLSNNMPFLLIQIKINFSFLETISIFLSLKRNYMQCNFSALTFSCLQFKRRIKLVIHIYIYNQLKSQIVSFCAIYFLIHAF
jgi:hypothetical protein